MRTPNGVTATEVTRNRCEELAKDPVHLQRLIDFWPPENITHILAREQLARLNAEPVGQVAVIDYSTTRDNGTVWVTLETTADKAGALNLDDKLYARPSPNDRSIPLPQRHSPRVVTPFQQTMPRAVMFPDNDGSWVSAFEMEHWLNSRGLKIKL